MKDAATPLQLLGSGVPEELRRLAEQGAPVALLGLDELDPEAAMGLLQFFLHDPAVTAPIEPFASLLAAMIGKRETSLWELCPRQAAPEASAEAFFRDLPRTHPECLCCACFPICQGYAAWAGSCATWQATLAGIAGAARVLARLGNTNAIRSTQESSHVLPAQS